MADSTKRKLQPQADEIADLRRRVLDLEAREAGMAWRLEWQSGRIYRQGEVATDGLWSMVANKQTTERPAPTPIGSPSWLSGLGNSPAWSNPTVTASRVISGQRYEPSAPGYVSGYRVWIPVIDPDIEYTVIVINDPEGSSIISFYRLDPEVVGWQGLPLTPSLVRSGTVWDVLLVTQHKGGDASFSGPWNYTTPTNERAPVAGEIVHARKAIDALAIHKTDANAVDRSADLASLSAGSTIEITGGVTYELLNDPIDEGAYITCAVLPEITGGADALYTFTFTTFGTASITYSTIADLYLSDSEIDGFFSSTDLVGGALDDDGYSPDVYWQPAELSDDWDVLAYMGGGGGADLDTTYLRLDTSNDPLIGNLEAGAGVIATRSGGPALLGRRADDLGTVINAETSDGLIDLFSAFANGRFAFRDDADAQTVLGGNQANAWRMRVHGKDDRLLFNINDDGGHGVLQDDDSVMLAAGAWLYSEPVSATGVSLGGANADLLTGTVTLATALGQTATLAGREMVAVIRGWGRVNNQPINAFQIRGGIDSTYGPFGFGMGQAAAAGGRSSAPFEQRVKIAAAAASFTWQINGRYFGTGPADADLYAWVDLYVAPHNPTTIP